MDNPMVNRTVTQMVIPMEDIPMEDIPVEDIPMDITRTSTRPLSKAEAAAAAITTVLVAA